MVRRSKRNNQREKERSENIERLEREGWEFVQVKAHRDGKKKDDPDGKTVGTGATNPEARKREETRRRRLSLSNSGGGTGNRQAEEEKVSKGYGRRRRKKSTSLSSRTDHSEKSSRKVEEHAVPHPY